MQISNLCLLYIVEKIGRYHSFYFIISTSTSFQTVDDSDDDAWSSSNEANFLMESSKNSYSTTKGSIARGRLGGGHLYTKDTPVLGRRTPQFSGQQQPSPLAASSTGVNGSSNFLAPPQPYYQQLPQVCLV